MIRLDRLASGEVEIIGLLPGSSNYTFLAKLVDENSEGRLVVYKPRRGEMPLWDFPDGTLCQREVAAYVVSQMGGWEFVPATVLREGPHGPGAVQEFVQHDPGFTAFEAEDAHESELMSIALFDLVVNNADRKAGHVLLGLDARLWAIDHGVCFAEEPKVRTVLWDFIGFPISSEDLARMKCLVESLFTSQCEELHGLISSSEIDALKDRATTLLDSGVFPPPGPGRPYPWPPV